MATIISASLEKQDGDAFMKQGCVVLVEGMTSWYVQLPKCNLSNWLQHETYLMTPSPFLLHEKTFIWLERIWRHVLGPLSSVGGSSWCNLQRSRNTFRAGSDVPMFGIIPNSNFLTGSVDLTILRCSFEKTWQLLSPRKGQPSGWWPWFEGGGTLSCVMNYYFEWHQTVNCHKDRRPVFGVTEAK